MPIETTAEVALALRTSLGEGSLWSPSLGKLLWVDILKHELHLFDPETNQDKTYHVDDGERFVSTVVERESGGVVSFFFLPFYVLYISCGLSFSCVW